MKALLAVIAGFSSAAPVKAARLLQMAQFLERIEYRWTIREYMATPAGLIQFMRDYWQMTTTPREPEL